MSPTESTLTAVSQSDIHDEPPASQESYCPMEGEDGGSPRIQPSVVPEDFLVNHEDLEEVAEEKEVQLSRQEHVLPKVRVEDAISSAPASQKEDEKKKEKELKELLVEAAAEDRVRAIEDGIVSDGADLWVFHEDSSLYKHSSCSIHNLTHLPKDPKCHVCQRANVQSI